MKQQAKSTYAKLMLVAATVIWGSSFFIMKNTLQSIPPFFMIALRFSVSTVLLSLLFLKRLKSINRDYLIKGFVLGSLLFIAYCFQSVGLQHTTPGKNAFLTTVYCIMVPFLCWLLLKVRPDRYHLLASLVCVAGIGFISLNEQFVMGLGDGLTLISGLFYALHIIAVSVYAKDRDIFLLTILQFAAAGVLGFVLSTVLGTFPVSFGWETSLSLVYLCVFCTTAALLMQNVGQKYTHPSTASILLSLESVFGILFSVVFYGEVLTVKNTFGFVLVFAAVLISETKLSFLRPK